MNDNIEIDNAIEILTNIGTSNRYEKICELNDKQKQHYCILLERLERVNESHGTNATKGKALEDIVAYLLLVSGGIFHVDRNLRTSTNEIDQLITLSPKGKPLFKLGLLPAKTDTFISECKNYGKKIDVTYIGKFCSLLLTTQTKLGILFSYHGLTGTGWNNASGVVKKFYLHKERDKDRYCIVDFNIQHFRAIREGQNLLQIISDRMNSLKYDTDYARFLSMHPAEI